MAFLKNKVIVLLLLLLPFVSNAQNNALNFDGVDDNVQVPHNSTFDLTTQYTFEAWIKLNAANYSGNNTILSKGHGNGLGVGLDDETYMFQIANGKLQVYMYQGPTSYWHTANTSIPSNTWTHVACTYDGVSERVNFYINGILDKSMAAINQAPATNTEPLIIGRQGYDAGCNCNHFNGEMDELRIWNRTLCQGEIQNNLNCEFSGAANGLIGNFHFNQGTGGGNNTGATNLSDFSGYGHDGTLTTFGLNGAVSNWVTSTASVSGTCTAFREINIIGNSNTITDGNTVPAFQYGTTLGTVYFGGGTFTRTFTIENTGGSSLTVSAINVSGPDAGSFSTTALTPAGPIAAGATATFDITFTSASLGAQNATITVLNDDCDEASYDFAIQGVGANFGATLNFDGVDDHIQCGDIDLTTFTLEAWVKTSTTGSHTILSKGDGNGVGENYIFQITNGNISLQMYQAGVSGWSYSTGTIPNNVWTHVAVTFDNTTHLCKFYINGTPSGTAGRSSSAPFQDNSITYLGKQGTSCNCNYFTGSMDNVRIWDKVLTQCELQAYMNCEIAFNPPGLIANYLFNEGIDGTAGATNYGLNFLTDYSGNGNTGFLNSFAYAGSTSNWIYPGGVVSGNGCNQISDISVTGNAQAIAGDSSNVPSLSDHTDFGSVVTGGGTQDRTFAILNNGGLLTLTANPTYVSIVGSSDFTVQTDAASFVPGFSFRNFTIRFTPSSAGVKTAKIRILSNDCDEPVYAFNVQGTGIVPSPASGLTFDGVDNSVSLANSTDLNFEVNNTFTLEFWFKTSTTANQVILSSATNAYPYNGYEVSTNSSGQLVFSMANNESLGNMLKMSTSDIVADGNWHHGAVVYNGISDASQIQLYVDEVLQPVIYYYNSLGAQMQTSGTVHIGARGNSGQSLFYNGSLDEIRIWNRALCSAELNSFNNCEINPSSTGLVAYYRFNDGTIGIDNSNSTLADQTGGNDGTLNSFTLSGSSSNWTASSGVVSGASCGALQEAEVNITGNGTGIPSGNSSQAVSDNTDFGNVQVGNNLTLNYRVENLGNAPLNFIKNPKISISGSAAFTVISQPVLAMVATGSQAQFQIRFSPTAAGTETATIIIETNDCDESYYMVNIKGTGTLPAEINVTQNSTPVPTGVNYFFEEHVVNSPNNWKIFTISNTSTTGKLVLNGNPKMELALADASHFAIDFSTVPDTIYPLSFANFNVKFLPTSPGNKTAMISFTNNDPDESPYLIFLVGRGVVSGDLDSNGTIDAGEIAGDTSGNGTIEYPSEVTGDVNGSGSINTGEIAGDHDGNGSINGGEIAGNTNGTGGIDNGEIAGDVNGNGSIDGNEFAGDVNGDGTLDPTEIIGDTNGDGTIVSPEVEGDINGDGIADPDPAYVLVGQGTIVSNYVSRYSVQPELPAISLPAYYTYAWVYSDTTLYMIKDTSRYFMDVVAHNQTNNGVLSCIIYRFGVPYDTLNFSITINRNYINIAELAELTSECAHVANPNNACQESFIDYFKLRDINYDGNGCVFGGYQDLTASGYTTDLEMGFTYTIELKPNKLLFFPNPQDPSKNDTTTVFYAVWIDYNNDGDFEDFAEYVKNGDSKSASTKLINITIANNELYVGSRRLRVGMKTGSGFTASDACGINAIGASGELEDYLITLVPMGALQAPNFLTPNNDGNNDLFSIKGVNTQKSRILTIINKAGIVVYQEENYGDKELWSGKDSNGELLPKGTYYYIFKNGSDELKSFLEIDY